MLLPNGSHPWDTEFNTGINFQMVPKVEQSAVLPFFNTAYRGITNQWHTAQESDKAKWRYAAYQYELEMGICAFLGQ